MLRSLIICMCLLTLTGCATMSYSPKTTSMLQQGKRDFDGGYYKTAMRELLPVACDGNAEAQYAVGYMYYYGFGVAQDTDVGAFWINRSAQQHYQPAINALQIIAKETAPTPPRKAYSRTGQA